MSKSNIEILLGEWGAWKRGENRKALGYPSQSAFQQMRVDGQRNADPDVLLVDDDLRRLDAEIEQLHSDYKAVLAMHHVKPGPVKAKAPMLNMSIRSYYSMLEHANRTLAHSMGGIYSSGFEPKLCAHVARACAHI